MMYSPGWRTWLPMVTVYGRFTLTLSYIGPWASPDGVQRVSPRVTAPAANANVPNFIAFANSCSGLIEGRATPKKVQPRFQRRGWERHRERQTRARGRRRRQIIRERRKRR